MSTRRFVLLTNGSSHGIGISEELRKRNFSFDSVLVVYPTTFSECYSLYPKRNLLSFLKAIRIFLLKKGDKRNFINRYKDYSKEIFFSGVLNSTDMVEKLKELECDFLILGGVGILSSETLSTAKVAVINSHPGLLPWARGSGVVATSIQRDVAVGSTCHLVSKGIDTGGILLRKLLTLKENETSLENIEKMNDQLSIDLMVETILYISSNNKLPKILMQMEKFPICKWLNEADREKVESDVRHGKAVNLYNEWAKKEVSIKFSHESSD